MGSRSGSASKRSGSATLLLSTILYEKMKYCGREVYTSIWKGFSGEMMEYYSVRGLDWLDIIITAPAGGKENCDAIIWTNVCL